MMIPTSLINTIMVGDCFDILPLIPNKNFHLIIVDPPYNRNQGFPNDNLPESDFLKFTEKWVRLAVSKLTEFGSFYCFINEEYLFKFKKIFDKYLRFNKLLIWWFEPSFRGNIDNYQNRCEYILFYTKSKEYTFNTIYELISKTTYERFIKYVDKNGNVPYENLPPSHKQRYKKENYEKNPRNIYRGAPQGNVFKIIRSIHPKNIEIKYGRHPSQKPEKLIEKLILTSSNPNDFLLDFFVGSGTTCVVAKKLHRNFIGIEILDKWANVAQNRLLDSETINAYNEKNQKTMF